MGNPWMDFLAEERGKDENKDVPPMELSSHVRPKYDAWKAEHGIASAEVAKAKTYVKSARDTMKNKYAKAKKYAEDVSVTVGKNYTKAKKYAKKARKTMKKKYTKAKKYMKKN
jgi:hypothetical protein